MAFDRNCSSCGKTFSTKIRAQRFCSKACAGSGRGELRNCLCCGKEFRAYRSNSHFCSENCRRRINKPKRRTCAANGCSKRFGYAKTPNKIYCSTNCGARDRYESKPLKQCKYCTEIVARRSHHGPSPEICDSCAPLHRRLKNQAWKDRNPIKWVEIKKRYASKIEALKISIEKGLNVSPDLLKKFAEFKIKSENEKLSTTFWLDLLDHIHYARHHCRIYRGIAHYDLKSFCAVKYNAFDDSKQKSKERAWERWKSRIAAIGLGTKKKIDGNVVNVEMDLELIKFVLDIVLGN